MNNTGVYKNVIDITEGYLGPAAQRFVSRQIENHLNKEPENLTKEDLIELSKWLRVSISLLTENVTLIEECISKIENLAKK